jgi:hypothetical protein
MVMVGSLVRVGPQEDARLDFMMRGYLARVVHVVGDMVEVDTDAAGIRQSVTFRAMVPLATLSEVEETRMSIEELHESIGFEDAQTSLSELE